MSAIDPVLLDLFSQQRGGSLITLKRDGRPQSSLVGHTFDPAGRTLKVSITDSRAKTRNLRRDGERGTACAHPAPRAHLRIRLSQLSQIHG